MGISKFFKALVICGYIYVIIQFTKLLLMERNIELIEIKYIIRPSMDLKRLERYFKKNHTIPKIFLKYKKPIRLPTDYKYVLKWTNAFSHYSSSIFLNGQQAFLLQNCSHLNCYMTNNKGLLSDIRHFDAILFDVENNWDIQPRLRAKHQKFIFTASESASNYPICHPLFDNYYNWTWTYKLDSNIRWNYITILDKNGTAIGPKINMTWTEPMDPVTNPIKSKLKKKSKIVAWFVSNCNTRSNRETVASNIEKALNKYGYTIDIYGSCSKLKCPRDRLEDCLDLLEKDYYFYLAFENSLSEDYVTEKILYPLMHYTVPIVLGGANYSRFLPPDSYLNAGEMNATHIASAIIKAVHNRTVYENYFKWRNHYTYKPAPEVADICTLCEILNDPKQEISTVKELRQWWNPNYTNVCSEIEKNEIIMF